jgi:PAS domain S-box-containing protein
MEKFDLSTQEELRHILRMKAEERLHTSLFQKDVPDEGNDEVLRLLYELQIHVIELEVQNENLWQMKTENEVQLRRYSELYSDLYDSAPVGYCTVSRDDGTILKANLTAAHLLGIERDDLVGVRFGLLVSAEYRDTVSALIKNADDYQKKNLSASARLLRAWQEPFWVNLQARESDSTRSCRLMFTDTNEQKQREELLERLSMVSSKTTNAIIITNAAGYITWVNEGFTNMTEYSFSEALGKKPGTFLQGKDTDWATILTMRNAILQAQGFEIEVLNYTKHTVPYWVHIKTDPLFDNDGALTGFISIQVNITQRKQEEARLKFKAQLLNNIGEAIIATDNEGKITFWNAVAQSLYGWSSEEAIGSMITDAN